MADRHDYYFRQPVTEAELDEGFAWLEQADWDLVVDQGLDGIVSGLGVAEDAGTPDLTVDVAGGTAYSHDGERINVVGTQDVDLSVDDLAVSTAVGSGGNEKWVSLFIEFDRVLGDARIDGAAMTVYFDRLESYAFSVVQGVEAGGGLATRPALDPSKVLLCDVLLTFGQTQIFDADINTDRREVRLIAASSFAYGGGPDWADGTTNPATDIESQIDKMLTELAQEAAGSDRILSAAYAGTIYSLTQASIYDQLTQCVDNEDALHAILDASANIPAVTRTKVINLVHMNVATQAGALDWRPATADRGSTLSSIVDAGTAFLDLGPWLPHGATLTRVRLLCTPGAARAVASRMAMSLEERQHTFTGTEAQDSATAIFTGVEDDGTTDTQSIDSGALSVAISSTKVYPFELLAGDDGGAHNNDSAYALQIQYTDPGPRNF